MPRFVFQFGYETPGQEARNARLGWDDESSEWVVIDAADEQSALDWGREIAERFVAYIGGSSWRAGDFADWLDPLSKCPWAVGRDAVAVGDLPDFGSWLR